MSRVVLLAALLAPALATAGGYYLPGIGSRSVGRAGAYVLSADDAGALWINPAALVRLRGEELFFSWDSTFVNLKLTYDRVPRMGEDIDSLTGEPIADQGRATNRQSPMPTPSLAYVTSFGLEDFVFSIGGYGPQRGDFLYDRDGPQRYALWKLDLTQKIYQLTAAWRAAEWVSIGAGFQVHEFDMQQYVVFSMWSHDLWDLSRMGIEREKTGWPEDPRFDAPVELAVENHLAPSFNAGVIFDLPNGWQVGGSFQYSIDIEADGTVSVIMPTYGAERDHYLDFRKIEMAGSSITALMNVPWIGRLGVRYAHPDELFDLELDIVYEAWSAHQQLRARTGDIHFRVPNDYKIYIGGCEDVGAEYCEYHIGDIVVDKHWRDSWSVRLGGEVRPLDWLRIRGGYYFDKGAIPMDTIQAGPLDLDKHAVAVGLTVALGALELDLAYSHVFQPDISIRGSSFRQIAPLNEEPEDYEPPADGAYDGYATHPTDGDYESSIDVFGFGFRLRTDVPGAHGRLTSGFLLEPVSHYVAIGVEASRYALEFEQGFADLIALNIGVELAEARAYMLDDDAHLGLGGTAGLKFFLTDTGIAGIYLFPRCSVVYLFDAGPMLTPSGELGYSWTWSDGLLLNLGISFMYTVYTDADFEAHTGPGTLLNFRIGYGW